MNRVSIINVVAGGFCLFMLGYDIGRGLWPWAAVQAVLFLFNLACVVMTRNWGRA